MSRLDYEYRTAGLTHAFRLLLIEALIPACRDRRRYRSFCAQMLNRALVLAREIKADPGDVGNLATTACIQELREIIERLQREYEQRNGRAKGAVRRISTRSSAARD